MAQPLVLLHGFTHTAASWGPVTAALGERYRPLALDIRGHGAAGARRPASLEAVVQDVAGAAEVPFDLAGYSMGGRIALHAALSLPAGRVRRLTLIGASPGIADAAERDQRRAADERLADELEHATIEQFSERWAQTPVLSGLPEDVLARVHADRLRNTTSGLAAALRGLGTGALPSLWDRLGELTMPVTLLVGERDTKFRGIAERMREGLPEARVVVVPATGHAVHLEASDRVAAALSG